MGSSSMQGACILQKEAQALLLRSPLDTYAEARHSSNHYGQQQAPADNPAGLSGMRAPLQQLCMAASLAPGCLPGALLFPAPSTPSAAPAHTPSAGQLNLPSYSSSSGSGSSTAIVVLWPTDKHQQQQRYIVQQAALAAQGVCAALATIQQQATAQFRAGQEQQQLSASQRQALQQVRAVGELRVRLQALVDHPSLGAATCNSSLGAESGACISSQGGGSSSAGGAASSGSGDGPSADPIIVSILAAVRGMLQQHDAAVQLLAAGRPLALHQQQQEQGRRDLGPPAAAGAAGDAAGRPGVAATLMEMVAGLRPLWGRLLELARLLWCLPLPGAPGGGMRAGNSPGGSGSGSFTRSSSSSASKGLAAGSGTWLPSWALPPPAAAASGGGSKETGSSIVAWPEWAQGWVEAWGWAPGAWQVAGLPPGTHLMDSIYSGEPPRPGGKGWRREGGPEVQDICAAGQADVQPGRP